MGHARNTGIRPVDQAPRVKALVDLSETFPASFALDHAIEHLAQGIGPPPRPALGASSVLTPVTGTLRGFQPAPGTPYSVSGPEGVRIEPAWGRFDLVECRHLVQFSINS